MFPKVITFLIKTYPQCEEPLQPSYTCHLKTIRAHAHGRMNLYCSFFCQNLAEKNAFNVEPLTAFMRVLMRV